MLPRGMKRLLAIALTVSASAPASAGAVTFGAENIESRTATNTSVTCGTVLAASCTSYSSAEFPPMTAAESLAVPLPDPVAGGDQTGRVDTVRIMAAPGPAAQAQLAVVEMSQPAGEGEAFPSDVSALSAVFTLNPGLNTVKTNLPVGHRLSPSGFVVRSVLAITILDATTPIPGEIKSYCSSIFTRSVDPASAFPPYEGLLTVGDLTTGFVQDNGLCNLQVLMQADMTPTTPPSGDAADKTLVAPKGPVLGFGRGVAAVKGRVAILPLTCGPEAACVGRLVLRGAGAAAARGPVVYGRGKVSIGAGRTRRVKVKLTKAGRALVRGRRRVRVLARVTYRSGGTASRRITLRRGARGAASPRS
jgi:hypothetical protein